MGDTTAVFHSVGRVPDSQECVNSSSKKGAKEVAQDFRSLGWMPSIPGDLLGSSLQSFVTTPLNVMKEASASEALSRAQTVSELGLKMEA